MLPDVSTLDSYGGPKADYSPIIDPTTDEGAKERNRYVTDTAMMTQTSPRAFVTFVGVNGSDPLAPLSGFSHAAQWGSAPSDKPSITRFSEGVYDLTYPTTVSTPLAPYPEALGGGTEAVIALNFRRAFAQVESADGTFKDAKAKVTGPNTVRVYCYSGTTLDDLPGLPTTVWIW